MVGISCWGSDASGSSQTLRCARFTASGSLDSGFGDSGLSESVDVTDPVGGWDLDCDADGNVLVGGMAQVAGGGWILARILGN